MQEIGTWQITRYAYDSRGNLVRVEFPDGHVIEYVVDGANRRVGRKLDGVLTHQWLWQGQLQPAAELDGVGNLVSGFVYGLHVNVPELILRGGRIYRVVTDQLGSVRMVVDTQSGSVAQRMRYDEWGRVLEDTNPGWQPFGFAGGLWETRTGLVRFGARDYDAGVGRWSAKDPLLFGGSSENLFLYARGDSVNLVDADGQFPWAIAGRIVGGFAVGFTGSIAFQLATSGPGQPISYREAATVGALVSLFAVVGPTYAPGRYLYHYTTSEAARAIAVGSADILASEAGAVGGGVYVTSCGWSWRRLLRFFYGAKSVAARITIDTERLNPYHSVSRSIQAGAFRISPDVPRGAITAIEYGE